MLQQRNEKGSVLRTSRSTARSKNKRTSRNQRAGAWRRIREQRPLHKRLIMHPLTMFTLLCTGVLLYGLTNNVLADTIVSSVVEAPPLQTGATIDTPADKVTVLTQPVKVTGQCPSNSYVNLEVNGAFDGVAWCNTDNSYSITASLHPASNSVTVQDYNITDLPGPRSGGITLLYQAPITTSSNTGFTPTSTEQATVAPSQTTVPVQTAPPILLTSGFNFKAFSVKQSFSWKLDLEGGVPPYHVHVDWGDGTSSNLVFKTDPVFSLTHQYTKAGYFPIRVQSTDTQNQVQVMQLVALIKDASGNEPFISTPKTGTSAKGGVSQHTSSGVVKRILPFAWPSYAILVLMTASFWLGEIRQYRYFQRPAHK